MSTKPETRVEAGLTVRIWGMGADGRPFFQNVQLRSFNERGAELSGVEHQLAMNDVIGIQLGDKKARCKVIEVRDGGQSPATQISVELLEGQPCPWQQETLRMEKPSAAVAQPTQSQTTLQPNQSQTQNQPQRRFERHKVPFPIEIQTENASGSHMRTQSTDISGRGCYVETLLPFPVGTQLNITVWLDSERIVIPAITRTCDGGVGMGIEFTGLDEQIQLRLQKQVEAMEADSGSAQSAKGGS